MEVSLILVIALTFFNIIRLNIQTTSKMKEMFVAMKK
ncbi:hypothetical protein Celal_2657 [Cellulophaga algicola DSM 14237]|uniref:Uncharacterized protein n=1 Tax=Cellulophaga algicola (strain DSM 14237 / IC166 / ACAM 630) TaxID=688270 RepID=E6XB78_CELAD|nr:hypothetical protein Celal_2657 [Cellulophaga algicola DSM 14237]